MPTPATRWHQEPEVGSVYGNGSKKFFGQNPPTGAAIYYSLNKKPEKASLRVVDYAGQTVRELAVEAKPGLHKVVWNLTRPSARPLFAAVMGTEEPEQALRRPGGLFGQPVNPGMYRVVLSVDGKDYTQGLRVEADPNAATNAIAAGDGDDDGDMDIDADRDTDRDPPMDVDKDK
jgi:hypothetical protein